MVMASGLSALWIKTVFIGLRKSAHEALELLLSMRGDSLVISKELVSDDSFTHLGPCFQSGDMENSELVRAIFLCLLFFLSLHGVSLAVCLMATFQTPCTQ